MIDMGEDQWAGIAPDIPDKMRKKYSDWLPTHCDDWELGLIVNAMGTLQVYAIENNRELPHAIGIPHAEMGEDHPMHPYMQIAWSIVSHQYYGEEIPMKYEVVT